MSSKLVDICDAAVVVIADATLAEEVQALRRWRPYFRPEDLEQLRVSVIPVTRALTEWNLAGQQWAHTFRVVVQRRLGDGDESGVDSDEQRVDALDALTEQIADLFTVGLDLAGSVVNKVAQISACDRDALDQRVFHAAIEVTTWMQGT